MKREHWQFLGLVLILAVAAFLRLYGVDWDHGYLFHPDERQVLLVVTRLHLPESVAGFLSPDSPLNPKFFAYGSFPIYLLKLLGAFAPPVTYPVPWADSSLVSLAQLGRVLSALFDLGSIVLLFFLARRLYGAVVAVMAAACVAVTVLNVQLAHFYTVDTVLTFFVMATLWFALRFAEEGRRLDAIGMAVAFGLALATKISAAPLVVPMIVAVIRAKGPGIDLSGLGGTEGAERPDRSMPQRRGVRSALSNAFAAVKRTAREWWTLVWGVRKTLLQILGIVFAAFVVTQPYMLLDPIQYFGQTGTEMLIARGWMDVPFTRQYAATPPFVYQIAQSSVWGMGLPLGLVAWLGSALFIWQWWRKRRLDPEGLAAWRDGFIVSWALVYFLTIGGQYAKHLRYVLPLLPFLFLMASAVLVALVSQLKQRLARAVVYAGFSFVILVALAYALAFVAIYSREHPWIQISRWIYQNIPQNSTLAIEHWDDALPLALNVGGQAHTSNEYHLQTLPLYDTDDAAKWQIVIDALVKSDYVILASPRLYATIPRLPERYPTSSRYYHLLFDGELGFSPVAFARNDPALGGITIADEGLDSVGLQMPPLVKSYFHNGLVWNWGRADESFVVYDHPMPLVFRKTRALSSDDLRVLLLP